MPCFTHSTSHSMSSHITRPSDRKPDSQSLTDVLWVLTSVNYKVPQALLGFHLQVHPFFSPEKEAFTVISSFHAKVLPFAGVSADSLCCNDDIRKYPNDSLLPSNVRSAHTVSETETSPCSKNNHCLWLRRMDKHSLAKLMSLWLTRERGVKRSIWATFTPRTG